MNNALGFQWVLFTLCVLIEYDQRSGRLIYIPVRELAQHTQTLMLMLIGHVLGTSAIGSVFSETIKGMMSGLV